MYIIYNLLLHKLNYTPFVIFRYKYNTLTLWSECAMYVVHYRQRTNVERERSNKQTRINHSYSYDIV